MSSTPFTGLWSSGAGTPTQSSGGFFYHPSVDGGHSNDLERIGVLSRTLVRSPTVQWVIPARIRHKDKNDVLFIGGDYVQIRQLLMYDQLHDVATKADFGSPIRAARVLGSERKPAASVLDQIVKQESDDDFQAMDVDSGINHKLPPQILALTLESQKLVFLFAFEGPSNKIDFICCTRDLPRDQAHAHLYGKHLAVDLKSRAMAISAQAGYFGIYSLKSVGQMHDEMFEFGLLDEEKFRPILEERYLKVDGIILKMEFLSLIDGEEDTVNLLLLVSRNQQTYAQLYQWDTTTRLHNMMEHRGQRVHAEEQIPLLLVPLTKNASFMIVSDKTVSIWNDIAFGSARRHREPLSILNAEPTEFGNSRRQPLHTQWARPVRHPGYIAEHDDLYLSREDGVVQLVEIKPLATNGRPVNIIYNIGPLDGSIDTAFAILDTGLPGGDDLLVACGDMSDVGLYAIRPRMRPISQQALPNWSPILDFVLIKGQEQIVEQISPVTSSARNRPTRDRIFSISGRGDENGSVNELRYGLEARVALTAEEEENSSIVQLWAFPDPRERVLFLLASYPWRSTLMHISVNGTDIDYGYDDETTGLDLGSPTLAAGTTSDGIVIQLTDSSIRATILSENGPRWSGTSLPDGARVVLAAVRGDSSLFAAVVRRGNEHSLYCGTFSREENKINCRHAPPVTLSTSPTCLSIENIRGTRCFVLGSNDATIQIISMTGDGLILSLEQLIDLQLTDTDNRACATVAVISNSSEDHQIRRYTLLCGLRSGNLSHFNISIQQDFGGDNISLCQTGFFKLGETAVRVTSDECDKGAAFVTCGQDFWKLSYTSDPESKQYVLESVYVTDRNKPYLRLGIINAHLRVEMFPYLGIQGLGGSLIFIHGKSMLITTLETTAKVVPRRLKISGTPGRIIYVAHLNKLVIAATYTDVRTRNDPARNGIVSKKRWLRPTLRVVDPDRPWMNEAHSFESEEETPPSPSNHNMHMPIGKAGERILALLAWTPTDGSSTYQYVVAGTRIQRKSGPLRGRLLLFSIKESSTPETPAIIRTQHQLKFDQPVYALASWGNDALVLCTGKKLVMQRVDLVQRKWQHVASFELRSPGVAISVREPYISIDTAKDSIFVFRFQENEFRPCGADARARGGQHVLNLSDSIVLASDKFCSVVGFEPVPDTSSRSTARTLFEACLHTSVTRLRSAFIRPSWMVDRRVVLGSTADGTLYQFTLLNRSEQQLLRFVQNLAKRDHRICPFRPRYVSLGHVDPADQNDALHMHIDGDVLSRVVDYGLKHLKAMIAQNPAPNEYQRDFETWELRKERFSELAAAVVGDVGDDDYKTEAVMEWMRTHLQLVL